MRAHSDRRVTQQSGEFRPPYGLMLEAPRTTSHCLSGATSPTFAKLLAVKPPAPITVYPST